MKELVGSSDLFNRVTGRFESAQIYRGLDARNLDDFERLWKPMLTKRQQEFSSWAASAQAKAQDSHWDWIKVAREAGRSLQYETFAVECAGVTQGLMLVNVTQFARLESQKGRELAYVELIASAPWNRKRFVEQPKYKGVGPTLLGTAVSLSVELGFKGRIGLHSLPQSDSWYLGEGLTDVEYDQVKRMRYFEMTEAQAAAFVSTKGGAP